MKFTIYSLLFIAIVGGLFYFSYFEDKNRNRFISRKFLNDKIELCNNTKSTYSFLGNFYSTVYSKKKPFEDRKIEDHYYFKIDQEIYKVTKVMTDSTAFFVSRTRPENDSIKVWYNKNNPSENYLYDPCTILQDLDLKNKIILPAFISTSFFSLLGSLALFLGIFLILLALKFGYIFFNDNRKVTK